MYIFLTIGQNYSYQGKGRDIMNCSKQVLIRKKGISLIETMIAVTIIAILQVAVLTNIKSSINKLRQITVQASENQIMGSIQAYGTVYDDDRAVDNSILSSVQNNEDKDIEELIKSNGEYFKRLSEILASSDIEAIIDRGGKSYITPEQLMAILEGNFVVDKGDRVIILSTQEK